MLYIACCIYPVLVYPVPVYTIPVYPVLVYPVPVYPVPVYLVSVPRPSQLVIYLYCPDEERPRLNIYLLVSTVEEKRNHVRPGIVMISAYEIPVCDPVCIQSKILQGCDYLAGFLPSLVLLIRLTALDLSTPTLAQTLCLSTI